MKIVGICEGSGKKPSKVNIALGKAGFKFAMLDLSSFCSEHLLENREKCYQDYLDNKRECDEDAIFLSEEPHRMGELVSKHLENIETHGMKNVIGRAPTLSFDTKRKDLDWLIFKLAIESMYVSKEAGCNSIIIEPLIKNIQSSEDVERNIEFYLSLVDQAKELGISILITNQYRILNGHYLRSELSDSYRFREFIDELNQKAGEEIFKICLDIGVCNLLGQNMYETVLEFGEKIEAVIIRENNGITDDSVLPFSCVNQNRSRLDWLNLIRGLRKTEFDGLLLCDFRSARLAVSHLLCQDLTIYAKKVMDFLYWQINMENVIRKYSSRVLFGAGNMCRNYMKCYGADYRPLYTCDNNSSIWGTQFEGLEIKNPFELKSLPKDCAIFICNIYYDEIEQQLLDMGITNPIERFNDEYLPSMYMDRFDAERREIRS